MKRSKYSEEQIAYALRQAGRRWRMSAQLVAGSSVTGPIPRFAPSQSSPELCWTIPSLQIGRGMMHPHDTVCDIPPALYGGDGSVVLMRKLAEPGEVIKMVWPCISESDFCGTFWIGW